MSLLSVVIPAYNAVDVLPRCLRSLGSAAKAGVEIVVVDDGSNDGTFHEAVAWTEFPIVALTQGNSGPGAARNLGASHASGAYVAFIDSDDEVAPGWHQFFLRAAAEGVALASCAMTLQEGTVCSITRRPTELGPAYDHLKALFLPGAYALRRDLFLSIQGFAENLPYGEHHELGLRLAPLLAGGQIRSTDRSLVTKHHDRSPRRVEGYNRARLIAAEYVLERHATALGRDAKLRGDYHAVAGYAAIRLGERSRAAQHMIASIRCRPTDSRRWIRSARLVLPQKTGGLASAIKSAARSPRSSSRSP